MPKNREDWRWTTCRESLENTLDDRVRNDKRTYASPFGMDKTRQRLRGSRYIHIYNPFTVESPNTIEPLGKEADGNISLELRQKVAWDGGGPLLQELRGINDPEQGNQLEPRSLIYLR
jgi:hypothetical protein